MVEAIANSADCFLISGLDFKISPSASYITDRKSVTFLPVAAKIIFLGKGLELYVFKLIRMLG